MRMIELETCPFCGMDAEIRQEGRHHFVACLDAEECGIEGYRALDEGYAVERWNTRVPSPPHKEQSDEQV